MVKRQIAVIGAGRFGTAVITTLFESGAEVLVIDEDEERINAIQDYCTQAIVADATDERVLEKIGINEFDTVIVCIATDAEASIFVSLTCLQMGVKQVIARASDRKHKLVLEKIGVEKVIIPEEDSGIKLANQLTKPNLIEVLQLTEDFRIVEIKTPVKWRDKTLIQLDLRKSEKVSIILIKRDNQIIVSPSGECVLLHDDVLVIAGTIEDTERLRTKATQSVLDD